MSEAFWVEVRMSDNVVHSELFVLALLGRVEAPQIKVSDANLQLARKENLVQLVRCCCHGGGSENGAGADEAVVPGQGDKALTSVFGMCGNISQKVRITKVEMCHTLHNDFIHRTYLVKSTQVHGANSASPSPCLMMKRMTTKNVSLPSQVKKVKYSYPYQKNDQTNENIK